LNIFFKKNRDQHFAREYNIHSTCSLYLNISDEQVSSLFQTKINISTSIFFAYLLPQARKGVGKRRSVAWGLPGHKRAQKVAMMEARFEEWRCIRGADGERVNDRYRGEDRERVNDRYPWSRV
jgi:hypothetical protein